MGEVERDHHRRDDHRNSCFRGFALPAMAIEPAASSAQLGTEGYRLMEMGIRTVRLERIETGSGTINGKDVSQTPRRAMADQCASSAAVRWHSQHCWCQPTATGRCWRKRDLRMTEAGGVFTPPMVAIISSSISAAYF